MRGGAVFCSFTHFDRMDSHLLDDVIKIFRSVAT